jgi:hypothetical protein
VWESFALRMGEIIGHKNEVESAENYQEPKVDGQSIVRPGTFSDDIARVRVSRAHQHLVA